MSSSSNLLASYEAYYGSTEGRSTASSGELEDVVSRRQRLGSTEVLVTPSFSRQSSRTETFSLLKSDIILRAVTRFTFGLLPCWPARFTSCHSTFTALILLAQVLALCEYIYCADVYWHAFSGPNHTDNTTEPPTGNTTEPPTGSPKIPLITLVMEIGIIISGIVSFALASVYFYSDGQDFKYSHSELIPCVPFPMVNDDDYIGPTPSDWLVTNICLALASLDIFFVILVDFQWDAYFNFHGVHKFMHYPEFRGYQRGFYYAYIVIFNWGLLCAVVSCCVFHTLARDIIRHVDAVESRVLSPNTGSYLEAREYHEYLLTYRDNLIRKFRVWFTTHNLLFFFILLCMVLDWFQPAKSDTAKTQLWFSQILASVLVAFKFAFPFFSASLVTARFQKMYYTINRQKMFPIIQDLPKFLDYAERCNYGFVLFGFKITTNVAFITILATSIGIFRFLSSAVSN
ncbi:uncharacterized protein LOC116616227 [Nematostella vectensis]|uniref:uncharacterized protein LOC116616227 n=1 Tax=Nematostella vectensis TaxID=45351 RepID=UPI002077552A|nr:uncharacterized protein LOC116616227 [Nematostella vectensis]